MGPTPRSVMWLLAICLCAAPLVTEGQERRWPGPPQRSGTHIPAPKTIDVWAGASGAYIPRMGDLISGRSWVALGNILWNFSPAKRWSLVGDHFVGAMGWDNVVLVLVANEAGLRFAPVPFLSVEAMYLNHRVDTTFVEHQKFYPAGVIDHGAEVAVNARFEPISRIRIGATLGGRLFHVYTEWHQVLRSALLLQLLPADGHCLSLHLGLLETWRHNQRDGVPGFTHNTMGEIRWESVFAGGIGISVSALVSANLLVGTMPMLELRRSMIGEPMGLLSIGAFTSW